MWARRSSAQLRVEPGAEADLGVGVPPRLDVARILDALPARAVAVAAVDRVAVERVAGMDEQEVPELLRTRGEAGGSAGPVEVGEVVTEHGQPVGVGLL